MQGYVVAGGTVVVEFGGWDGFGSDFVAQFLIQVGGFFDALGVGGEAALPAIGLAGRSIDLDQHFASSSGSARLPSFWSLR